MGMGGRVVDDDVGLAGDTVTSLVTAAGGSFDAVPEVPESPAALDTKPEPAVLPLLSVVVPAYNEALMIMGSLTTLYAYLQDLSDRYRFELIVVDDGSTDETAAIAEAFAGSRPEVRVLRHQVNFRLGQALRYGINQSKGDYVVTFDSDLSYSPDHIERLVEALRDQHARICVASPYMKGGRNSGLPWNRKVMSKSVNKLLAASSQYEVSTVTGLVRAYDGPFIRGLNLKSMGPEINTEILYKAQILRARVVEIPAHLDWTGQTERMKSRKVSLKVSSTSKLLMFSSFLFRPITFFLVPGLILLAISAWSLGALAWTVIEGYGDATGSNFDARLTQSFADAWQQRPHSFIIGGITFVVAVQLVSLGVLAAQAKRYFEDLFHIESRVLRQVAQVDQRLELLESSTAAEPGSQSGPAR
jgi:glycosyltransferase involved in cell wall biosynthesis